MPSIPEHQHALVTQQASFDAIVREFVQQLRREGVSENYVSQHRGPARHFLTWLERMGIALETVGGTVIHCFLQHDCDCSSRVPKSLLLYPWRKRERSPEVMRFVRFLEQTGRIVTPGDLLENLRILDAFLDRLRDAGYTSESVRAYRSRCTRFIAWLHLFRVRLRDVTPEVLKRFQEVQFLYSIPGIYYSHRPRPPGTACKGEVRRFLKHLATIGWISSLEPTPANKTLPERLEKFCCWLERNRGIGPDSAHRHIDLITTILPDLGADPRIYDVALIRRVLFLHMEHRTRPGARRLTTAMRMYLRFLASEGCVSAALAVAVPSVPEWRRTSLPRYISADDVERAIASCDTTHAGVRDRAILVLLSRLALRAGDIAALRLGDIDWNRAVLHISGESRQRAALPLPQDVGDALYRYLATVRPRTGEEKVFPGVRAPHRPFAGPIPVSSVARRALDRAGIVTFATRGAHVFRHSQASALLRSGATLDVVGSLLRHTSANTTMIYAKVDAVMLQEIAQPWIGGTKE